MGKPSQVIVLVEDSRQQQFVRRYLRRCGLDQHAMRLVRFPAGAGSGEQFVRKQFAAEVRAYRQRRARAETALIVVMDADNFSVQERMAQLDEAQIDGIPAEVGQIARLIPKRNIETWILCLNDERVDEETDYKRNQKDWTSLIRSGIETLYVWTRPYAPLPTSCVSSLRSGIAELRRLDFRGN